MRLTTGYYTVIVPYVPVPFQTEWHPTDPDPGGAFHVLSRGTFTTVDAAIHWASTRLNGTPYGIRFIVY